MGNLVFLSTNFETIYQANFPCYFVNTVELEYDIHFQGLHDTMIDSS